MHKEISEVWDDIEKDDSVAAIILTGEGRSFSAGGDLNHERKVSEDYGLRLETLREARNLVYGMLNCSHWWAGHRQDALGHGHWGVWHCSEGQAGTLLFHGGSGQ